MLPDFSRLTLHDAYPITSQWYFQSSSSESVDLSPCLHLSAESIAHLLLIPYFNSALLQPSFGSFFFLLPLPNPDSHGSWSKTCRAIHKQHCWESCRPHLLNSYLTQLSFAKQGRGPRAPMIKESHSWTEALYLPGSVLLASIAHRLNCFYHQAL